MTYNIALFEREAESGGRVKSTTISAHEFGPLEVGASSFSGEDIILNGTVESIGFETEYDIYSLSKGVHSLERPPSSCESSHTDIHLEPLGVDNQIMRA